MIDFTKYSRIADYTFFKSMGKVENVVGLTIESAGPEAKLGDLCMVFPADKELPPIMSEVVGFKGRKTLLMPYEKTEGIGIGCTVENTGIPLSVQVSDALLGQVLDGLGRYDGMEDAGQMINYPIEAAPPDAMEREIIDEVLSLGVKAVDGLMTIGKGQRIGGYVRP